MTIKCLRKEFKTIDNHIMSLTYKDEPPFNGFCVHIIDEDCLYYYEKSFEFNFWFYVSK